MFDHQDCLILIQKFIHFKTMGMIYVDRESYTVTYKPILNMQISTFTWGFKFDKSFWK